MGHEGIVVENVKIEDVIGMSSCRKRTIASDRRCVLKTLSEEERSKVYTSPRQLYMEKYHGGVDTGEPLILVNCMGFVREATRPGFCVTSNPARWGRDEENLKPIPVDVIMKMMTLDPDEIDWTGTTAENSEGDKKKKIAQMVPPRFAMVLALAVMNGTKEWEAEQLNEIKKTAGSGGGPRGALLPDVRMVRSEDGKWEVVRIVKGRRRKTSDSAEAEILVCASRDLKARWYPAGKICRVDCRVFTRHKKVKNVEKEKLAGHVAPAEHAVYLVERLARSQEMRPEGDEKNVKYVEWNAAFKDAGAGIEKGQRAVITKTGEPCEVLRRTRPEKPMSEKGIMCEVSLPRLGKVKNVKLCEIEPYSYERSSRNANGLKTGAIIQECKGDKSRIKLAQQLISETRKRAEHVASARNDGKEVDLSLIHI